MEERGKYLNVKNLTSYKISSELSDFVWTVVARWDWFAKNTIGSQFIRSADSIGANIAEGFGRYHKKDKIKFYLTARGSVFESEHWRSKAQKRKLLNESGNEFILIRPDKLPKEINLLIKLTDKLKI